MLKVKQVRKYSLAKYPSGNYQEPPEHLLPELLRDSAMVAGMMLLVESCSGGGQTGPPPVLPDMVTESEARSIVNRVLQNNGITWQDDAPLALSLGGSDTAHLVIDSYNDSLRVGYEYVSHDDYNIFTPQVTAALDSLAKGQGPYIEVIEPVYKYEDTDYEQFLESTMQQFLDTLKAHGVI
ncbi:MAG: hypothetical protein E4G91_05750 [Candidatus Zixiibacteriota bacterium]|nr:MAG: hypothetical protein E4G91_05750 [candidate division Zixibacteria bacterium]